jgi:hypothetical protein
MTDRTVHAGSPHEALTRPKRTPNNPPISSFSTLLRSECGLPTEDGGRVCSRVIGFSFYRFVVSLENILDVADLDCRLNIMMAVVLSGLK